jgi:hypothetical protein
MMSRVFGRGSQGNLAVMTRRLLDRQSSLIHYLTSGAAIFNDADRQPAHPALRGIDRRLLGIEARFSFEKRMEKIAAVFPRTFDLLGAHWEMLVREFVEACPPFDIGRLENARQFFDFLSACWRRELPAPPHLPDVAACELAFATARMVAEDRSPDEKNRPAGAQQPQVRRSRAVILLRSTHDIQPLFENASATGPPIARDVPLAIVAQASIDHPKILEIAPEVFDLLGSLGDWVDQAIFDEWEDAGQLITDLAIAGLVEKRR